MATTFEARSSLRSSQQTTRQQQQQQQPQQQNQLPQSLRSSANHTTPLFSQSQSQSHPQATADTLPSTDFGFDGLRQDMASFTSNFDNFITKGRHEVLAKRNEHRMRLSELGEEAALRARAVDILRGQQASHAAVLQREAADKAKVNAVITALSSARDSALAGNEALAAEIEATRNAIREREAAQRTHADRIAAQARLNAPELAFYEDNLGLRIESSADDEISFVFCCIDDRDPEREASVTLDLGRRDYSITATRPALHVSKGKDKESYEEMQRALDILNETRELAPFLKRLRTLFRSHLRDGRA